MFFIIGLGNPGFRYRKTRHNAGFMAVDYLAGIRRIRFSRVSRLYQQALMNEFEITLVKPMTYMNRSGDAVSELISRCNVPADHLLVLCDDFSLPLGRIRIKRGGGDGGQKGLASILNAVGSEDVPRLRMGVGLPSEDAIDFVLTPFRFSERRTAQDMIRRAGRAALDTVRHGIEYAMNEYNSF